MRIDPNGSIGRFPVLFVRKAVRRLNDRMYRGSETVQQVAGLDPQQAADLIRALQRAGLAEANRRTRPKTWTSTDLARSFAAASAAKPISRQTAATAFQAFLSRVDHVNSSEYFLGRVTKVVLFGSYLRPEVDRLGDIDLGVELRPRESDYGRLREATQLRLAELESRGRHVTGFLERETWWRSEVLLFLKSRSRAISLHDYAFEKELIDSVPHRVIFSTAEKEEEREEPKKPSSPVRRSRRPPDCPF